MSERKAEGDMDDCEFQVIDEVASDDEKDSVTEKGSDDSDEDESEEYRCKECNTKHVDLWQLQFHSQQHHADTTPTCVVCNETFEDMKQVYAHSLTHDSVRRSKCNICGKGFTKKSEFNTHKKTHYKELKCPRCKQHFGKTVALFNHIRKHHPFMLEDGMLCCKCDTELPVNWGFIENHIQKNHKKEFAIMSKAPFNPLKYVHFAAKKAKWFNYEENEDDLEFQILDEIDSSVVSKSEAGTSRNKHEEQCVIQIVDELLPEVQDSTIVKMEKVEVKKEKVDVKSEKNSGKSEKVSVQKEKNSVKTEKNPIKSEKILVKMEKVEVKEEPSDIEDCEFQIVDELQVQDMPDSTTEEEPVFLKMEDCEFEVLDELVSDNEDSVQLDEKDRDYTCKYCGKHCLSLWPLQIHVRNHTGGEDSTPTCVICGKRFHQIHHLKEHSLKAHSTTKKKCVHCKKTFHDRSKYEAHKLTHRDFKCPRCREKSKNRNVIFNHIKSEHPTLYKAGMKCRKCSEKFKYWRELTEHVRKSHSQNIELLDWFSTVPKA